MYGTSGLRVPAVVQPQTDDDAVAPARNTSGELLECLDIVSGISQMPQGTSRPGSTHMRIGLGELQPSMSILCLATGTEPDSSLIWNANPVELVSFDPCIHDRQLITIWISDSDQEIVMAPASLED